MSIDAIGRRDPGESEDERMTDAATHCCSAGSKGSHRSAVLFVCASHSLSRARCTAHGWRSGATRSRRSRWDG